MTDTPADKQATSFLSASRRQPADPDGHVDAAVPAGSTAGNGGAAGGQRTLAEIFAFLAGGEG